MNSRSWFTSIFILSFGILFSTIAIAQQGSWAFAPFAGEANEVLKASSAIPPDKYPYATVLLDEMNYSVDEGRRITRTHRLIYRLDSPKAVESWGRTSAYWEPWHQERPELKARVISPDGKVYWLDEKTLTDSPARQQSDDIYTDTRYLGGPLPGVMVGSIVEEYSIRKDKEPLFSAGTVQRFGVGAGYPIAETRVIVEYPSTLAIKTKVINAPGVKERREETAGRVRLIYESPRIESLPPVPEMLAPDVFPRGMIEFTTADSWKAVNSTYFKTVSEKVRVADVVDLVKQTIDPKDSRQIKIAKLIGRLHKEVRYTGIEFGEAALIPKFPQETLQHHFGDCKDKSAMLVAMLRAANIPAYLALVRTSTPDSDPELPGLGLFDHAIVYVPGTPDPLWIDATAEYNVLGNLPSFIRGRMALVVDGSTDKLVRIPESHSSGHKLVESREFYLSEYGPARVVEIGESTGFIDSGYRSYFNGPATKDRKESLESYGNNVYLTNEVSDAKFGDGRDLLKPFQVELEFKNARRGFTDLDEAVAAVRFEGLFSRMPQFFRTPKNDKKQDSNDEAEPKRTADYVFEPYQMEWHYKVHPPLGFRLHAVPAVVDRNLGPAKVTQHWKVDPDGVVEGVIVFDSTRGRYTVEEAEAARDAMVQMLGEPALMLRFDNAGAALIAQGKIREGLDEYERVIAAEPKQPLHRVRLSRALLQAGLGEQARQEAEAAVQLDGKSSVAYINLGWTLEHDILGRRFEHGFDRDGAVAAYKNAIENDPKEIQAIASLAIISEFDRTGERYGEDALLKDAIERYDSIKSLDKDQYDQYEINQVLDIVYSRDFDRVLSQLGNRASEPRFRHLAIASMAASKGSEAALLLSSRLTSSQQDRSDALRNAAQVLLNLREYQLSADLLDVGAQGTSDSANLLAQSEYFRRTQRAEKVTPSPNAPESGIHRLFVDLMTRKAMEQVLKDLSRSWNLAGTKKGREMRIRYMRATLQNVLGNSDLPKSAVLDMLLSNTQYSVEGDDATGYRVWVRLPDREAEPIFVVREEGQFRVLGFRDEDPLGWEALSRLKAGNKKAAAQLLDWARQQIDRGEAEDPIGGNLFARMWEKGNGSNADSKQIEAAALALALSSSEIDLTGDAQRVAESLPPEKKADAERLLWQAYSDVDKWTEAGKTAATLYSENPKSRTAFLLNAVSLVANKKFSELEKVSRERLQSDPDDEVAINMVPEALIGEGKAEEAREFLRARIKAGRAKADELNNYAWHSLFTKVDDEALEVARRSSAVASQYSVLHTLACLYAEVGKTAEARELMLKALASNYLDELDSSLWYVYGRIAEHYGQEEAARQAYLRVEKPEQAEIEQSSTYRLATIRLAAMNGKGNKAGGLGK